ncbi:hypothetical protein [Agriterribacter sp.]|uniref:hypothetical protein n=1 Tax=Agriterribacter sp. TaxID=2821509 RepID=UPI002BC6B3A1|nr:hypothetical protein [Agriterribacter sp.]HRO48375.1 hypothetical protein [Agriterribacter sp.]HRQ19382.1 hypothetical protein [Agriterribacter sp.]
MIPYDLYSGDYEGTAGNALLKIDNITVSGSSCGFIFPYELLRQVESTVSTDEVRNT